VILIDDFMKGGATLKGMIDLMNEFGATVVGKGIFISTTTPHKKMVDDYISLIQLDMIDEKIVAKPNLETFI
jgi:purine operon repressor